jgi:hypothetical protein
MATKLCNHKLKRQISTFSTTFFLYCRVPVTDAPRCTTACRLTVQPENLELQLAPPSVLHVTLMPVTLAVKGGTIGQEMAGKFGQKVVS